MTASVKTEFEFVGDWACELEAAVANEPNANWPMREIRHLGPICEIGNALARSRNLSLSEVIFPFETQTTRHLVDASKYGQAISAIQHVGAIGFLSFSSCHSNESAASRLTDFIDEASRRCKEAGIPKGLADASTGALEEMSNNALTHSMLYTSAVIGFRAQRHLFEFVTFDYGIGILASLKQKGFFSTLTDEAEALEISIVDGVSRHGPNTGHGYGFRQIFNMPNNHAGYFWLHSGMHALVVDSGTLRQPEAHIRQVHQTNGVLVSAAFKI